MPHAPKNYLFYIEEDCPSRFVVDLKEKFAAIERKKTEKKDFNFLFSKLPEFYNETLLSPKNALREIALISLFSVFSVIIKKIALGAYLLLQKIGWLAIFFIRFIFLFFVNLAKLLSAVYLIIFTNWKNVYRIIKALIISWAILFADKVRKVLYIFLYKLKMKKFSSSPNCDIAKKTINKTPIDLKISLKSAIIFTTCLVIMIIPFKLYGWYNQLNELKGRVLGVSKIAFNDLFFGGRLVKESNFDFAGQKFLQASENFYLAERQIGHINKMVASLAALTPNKELRMASEAENLLAIGKTTSLLAQKYVSILNAVISDNELKLKLLTVNNVSDEALILTKKLEQLIGEVNIESLPNQYAELFVISKGYSGFITKTTENINRLTKQLITFTGVGDGIKTQTKKRYLAVFQNNTEIRATGGFIGSYALIDFQDGKLINIEVPKGGSYDTEAGLNELILSPQPMHLIRTRWFFWDANWWPDWPTSAKKLMWFYEKSNGPTVDGVISFTPEVIERLLSIIGPIDMTENYGVVINADNFLLNTRSSITEQKNTNQPKKIIGDLAQKIIEIIPKKISRENIIEFSRIIEQSMKEKNILFYFSDDQLQNYIKNHGWSGEVVNTSKDYLMVVNTNIAGGKSDKKITQQIFHQAEIQSDGSVIDSLTIIREHRGIKNEPFSGVRNVNWLRIYVPEGSKLISADGFESPSFSYFKKPELFYSSDPDLNNENIEFTLDTISGTRIYRESNKTVFANWSMVDPGKKTVITIRYRLPFNIFSKPIEHNNKFEQFLYPSQKTRYTYSLYLQKQSGAKTSSIESRVILLDNSKLAVWHYPKDLRITDDQGWIKISELNSDKLFAFIIE